MFSTRGIVLDHVRYSETSIIVHIYTELFGRQSYMVNGVRKAKSKGKAVFLQPLTLLRLEVSHHERKGVHRIRDFRTEYPFSSLPFDQTKRSIAFFLTEVLSKVLREEEADPGLFEFVYGAIEVLDEGIEGLSNFHLFFLVQLSRFLGFSPALPPNDQCKFFDLKSGIFKEAEPFHPYYLNAIQSDKWRRLLNLKVEALSSLKINSHDRNELLNSLLEYYALHSEGFGKIKSLEILHQLFHSD